MERDAVWWSADYKKEKREKRETRRSVVVERSVFALGECIFRDGPYSLRWSDNMASGEKPSGPLFSLFPHAASHSEKRIGGRAEADRWMMKNPMGNNKMPSSPPVV